MFSPNRSESVMRLVEFKYVCKSCSAETAVANNSAPDTGTVQFLWVRFMARVGSILDDAIKTAAGGQRRAYGLGRAVVIPLRDIGGGGDGRRADKPVGRVDRGRIDRKSTRLNSSHLGISYAVFCLKK